MYLLTATVLLIVAIVLQEGNPFIAGMMTGSAMLSMVGFTITAIQIEKSR